jgi:hypothetical protein
LRFVSGAPFQDRERAEPADGSSAPEEAFAARAAGAKGAAEASITAASAANAAMTKETLTRARE